MKSFNVTVTTNTGQHEYAAIAWHSFDVHSAAVTRFGICKISVRPL